MNKKNWLAFIVLMVGINWFATAFGYSGKYGVRNASFEEFAIEFLEGKEYDIEVYANKKLVRLYDGKYYYNLNIYSLVKLYGVYTRFNGTPCYYTEYDDVFSGAGSLECYKLVLEFFKLAKNSSVARINYVVGTDRLRVTFKGKGRAFEVPIGNIVRWYDKYDARMYI